MPATVEIPKREWSSYLQAVSREMQDADLAIEVSDDEWHADLAAEHLALQFMAYDRRDELFEVAGAAGPSHVPDVFRHLVDAPRRIVVNSPGTAPSLIEIEGGDGQRTVIRLDRAGDS